MSIPLLTIVVPTADRPNTAEPCVRSLSAIAGNLEILIADCSKTDALRARIDAIGDPRIRYTWSPPCSMTANWNRALAHVSGDYVIFIGDDDSLAPSCITVLEQLAENRPEAIAYPYDATYFWDDFPDPDRAGKLVVIERAGRATARRIDARACYLSIMRGNHSAPPPVIYHGIVARSVLEAILTQFGEVFRTSAPDTYLTGLLAGTLHTYVLVSRPLSLFGKSGASNSARLVHKTEHQHLDQYSAEEITRHELLPPVDTVEVHVADSHYRAILAIGDRELLNAFHHNYLAQTYVRAMSRNRARAASIAKHLFYAGSRVENLAVGQVLWAAARFAGRRFASRLLRRPPESPSLARKTIDCGDLLEAQALTEALFWSESPGADPVELQS